jgi:hypothetical protein
LYLAKASAVPAECGVDTLIDRKKRLAPIGLFQDEAGPVVG